MSDKTEAATEVVVVTGASAGLGRAISCAFAKRGAKVGLIARGGAGTDGLEGARRDVERLGGTALMLPCDVADPEQVEAAAQKAEDELGPIDVWVNDAMTSVFGPVHEIEPHDFKRVTEVTYLGQVYGAMAALKRMKPRDRGHIILVGSALAYRGIPLQSAYCGSKHAIQGFADSLRAELLHDGSKVHLCMVQMPAMNTPQFEWVKNLLPDKPQPVPPIFQPEVAAEAVYWAAHHRRRELFVGGSTDIAILGNKLFPQVGDWYLSRTGFKSQQRQGRPAGKGAPDNLWEALPGDRGAHGPFDKRAKTFSLQLWLSLNRKTLLVALGVAGLAAVAVGGRKR
jgi:NAD(P)-dependent dehydrogenase (short-subunit alcohol dehydrogenase family)